MKKLLPILVILISSSYLFSQNNELDGLKKYNSYIIKHLESGKWSTKCDLINGLVTNIESYYKRELRSRRIYEYDKYKNKIREIRTFDINEGVINDTMEIKLIYIHDSLVAEKHTLGTIEKFSDFNEFGKPKMLERTEEFGFSPFIELFEYDKAGNVSKEIAHTEFKNAHEIIVRETETNFYTYDLRHNVIEIRRKYSPKKTFPIPITGGPALYEIENFRYVYNKYGLWTKKYKTVEGTEKLIARRTLK
tara:strand:+ start:22268 stop:23014 length:747 start_codon:yes stop_codon:yes gene_type:complete